LPYDDSEVFQSCTVGLQVDRLPDGSAVVVDDRSKTVHALNRVAAAAFDVCREPAAFSVIVQTMSDRLQAQVSHESARTALTELENVGLARPCAPARAAVSRRSALQSAAAGAIPMVLSLTAAQQRMYAQAAGSGAPVVSVVSINPGFLCIGNVPNVVITGENTHFTNSSVVTFSDTNVVGIQIQASSATSLTLTVEVGGGDDGSSPHFVDVTVTTGSETAFGAGILEVAGCG
jgi:hypothetical protein